MHNKIRVCQLIYLITDNNLETKRKIMRPIFFNYFYAITIKIFTIIFTKNLSKIFFFMNNGSKIWI